jgi:hypothetical protein
VISGGTGDNNVGAPNANNGLADNSNQRSSPSSALSPKSPAFIGIIIGALIAAACCALLLLLVIRRRRKTKKEPKQDDVETGSTLSENTLLSKHSESPSDTESKKSSPRNDDIETIPSEHVSDVEVPLVNTKPKHEVNDSIEEIPSIPSNIISEPNSVDKGTNVSLKSKKKLLPSLTSTKSKLPELPSSVASNQQNVNNVDWNTKKLKVLIILL